MPRSGSTLVQNLLAQHPQNHCTPTSDLIELVVQARNSYGSYEGFRSQGVMQVAPRIRTALRGMIQGFYAEEFECGKTVFEKSRGWLAYVELIEDVLEQPVKIVCCVRDIREIVASFERLYRTNQLTKADTVGDAYFECQTIEGRVRQLLAPQSVVGLAINRLRDVFDRGVDDRLVIVPYAKLVADPVGTIFSVSGATGTMPFLCDASRVEQKTHEDDSVHGMRLHDVRPIVSREGSTAWQDYLPERIGEYLHEQYSDIQDLAGTEPSLTINDKKRETAPPVRGPVRMIEKDGQRYRVHINHVNEPGEVDVPGSEDHFWNRSCDPGFVHRDPTRTTSEEMSNRQ